MKKLLTVLFLALGAVAFANESTEPVLGEKNTSSATVTTKKMEVNSVTVTEGREPKARPVATRSKGVCTTCSSDARFNISGYFAEFVNRNNLKLVKLLLAE